MKINIENKQRIHDVLLTDMQRRIFKQYNARKDEFKLTDEDYDVQQTLLVDSVLHCETLNDVNELVMLFVILITILIVKIKFHCLSYYLILYIRIRFVIYY